MAAALASGLHRPTGGERHREDGTRDDERTNDGPPDDPTNTTHTSTDDHVTSWMNAMTFKNTGKRRGSSRRGCACYPSEEAMSAWMKQ
jgi:hypothetical protein